jgi:hypothetical protein
MFSVLRQLCLFSKPAKQPSLSQTSQPLFIAQPGNSTRFRRPSPLTPPAWPTKPAGIDSFAYERRVRWIAWLGSALALLAPLLLSLLLSLFSTLFLSPLLSSSLRPILGFSSFVSQAKHYGSGKAKTWASCVQSTLFVGLASSLPPGSTLRRRSLRTKRTKRANVRAASRHLSRSHVPTSACDDFTRPEPGWTLFALVAKKASKGGQDASLPSFTGPARQGNEDRQAANRS